MFRMSLMICIMCVVNVFNYLTIKDKVGMNKCRCSLRVKLIGDGCKVCNPEMAREIEEENNAENRREISEAFSMGLDYLHDWAWHCVAEYFTHE